MVLFDGSYCMYVVHMYESSLQNKAHFVQIKESPKCQCPPQVSSTIHTVSIDFFSFVFQ